jgi:hypothetical protein
MKNHWLGKAKEDYKSFVTEQIRGSEIHEQTDDGIYKIIPNIKGREASYGVTHQEQFGTRFDIVKECWHNLRMKYLKSETDDTSYFRNRLFTMLKIPKNYLDNGR